jgi:multidrug efflux pump subunit AcrA (membrane-fusion protein)
MNDLLHTNIDENPLLIEKYPSIGKIYLITKTSKAGKWLLFITLVMLTTMFLPWTQNIRAKGKVTAFNQQDRPQELNTIIPGRIEKWYIREGDFVQKGDTILKLSEVKTEYLDPSLTTNVNSQINAKEQAMRAYFSKAEASSAQIIAFKEARELKLASIDNKIVQQLLRISSDSADLAADINALDAYSRQIDAAQEMLDKGALSLIEFEKRRVNYQNGKAKVNSSQNKLDQSRQELLNLRIERNSTIQDYAEKIAKTEGERFSGISSATTTEAEIAKLKNELANYTMRQGFLYLLAPQNGQITKARKAGIGEIMKEGEMIVEIVPAINEKAVELYVQPMDLPLISLGQKVRFIFDGFPVIVFSGWPKTSYGTFGGQIAAIETSAGVNGLFKVLVIPDPNEKPWPEMLKIGGGANGIALLKDVPIFYEFWRNINGFPPEYYQFNAQTDEKADKK